MIKKISISNMFLLYNIFPSRMHPDIVTEIQKFFDARLFNKALSQEDDFTLSLKLDREVTRLYKIKIMSDDRTTVLFESDVCEYVHKHYIGEEYSHSSTHKFLVDDFYNPKYFHFNYESLLHNTSNLSTALMYATVDRMYQQVLDRCEDNETKYIALMSKDIKHALQNGFDVFIQHGALVIEGMEPQKYYLTFLDKVLAVREYQMDGQTYILGQNPFFSSVIAEYNYAIM